MSISAATPTKPSTPPAKPRVLLAKGAAVPAVAGAFRYHVAIEFFPPNANVTIKCFDSVSPRGFFTFTMKTNDRGHALVTNQCYSGDGPDHWVTANGKYESNHVRWGKAPAAPKSPPPSRVVTVVNASGGVYWRGNPPDWKSPIQRTGYGVYNGDRVELVCWRNGSTVPPLNNNSLWYQARIVSGRGKGEGFVNDHFLDTGINQPNVKVPGVPQCAATQKPIESLSKYAGYIVQWDGDKKAQKTSWLVTGDLKRRWIPDIATYNCLIAQGVKRWSSPLPSSVLDRLPDLTGVHATCGSCVAYVVLDSRGSGGTGISPPGRALRDELTRLVKPLVVVAIGNPYPAAGDAWSIVGGVFKVGVLGRYHDSVVEGKNDLTEMIKRRVRECPSTKLILTGFSQGAQVTADVYQGHDVRQQLSSTERSHIIGAALFGDPHFNSGDSAVRQGTYTVGLDGLLRTRGLFGEKARGTVFSYCQEYDPVCQGVGGFRQSVGLASHHNYVNYQGHDYPGEAARVFADR